VKNRKTRCAINTESIVVCIASLSPQLKKPRYANRGFWCL